MIRIFPYEGESVHDLLMLQSRLTVKYESQMAERLVDMSQPPVLERTGRLMVVVEGEEELVGELLGKNFPRRLERLRQKIEADTQERDA